MNPPEHAADQLPESAIPYDDRLLRIHAMRRAGATREQLRADVEVAESVRNLNPR